MHWTIRDNLHYSSGLWSISAKNDNGILKWAIWHNGKELGTRRNLSKAKEYVEQRESAEVK